jgi:hypothetical protein
MIMRRHKTPSRFCVGLTALVMAQRLCGLAGIMQPEFSVCLGNALKRLASQAVSY